MKTLALLSCLAAMVSAPLAASGARTFEDRFDGDLRQWGPAQGKWQVKDGALIQDSEWTATSLAFPEKTIGRFELVCRVRFDGSGADPQVGLTADRGEGYWLITLRPGSLSWSFIVPGQVAGLFHGGAALAGRKGDWTTLTVACRDNRLTLGIDGETFLAGPAPGRGRVCLKARRGASLDDVKLTYDTDGSLYPNRQINGSFEHATNGDVPDYWGLPSRWTRMNGGLPPSLLTAAGIAEFRNKWRLDATTAFDGKQSLRVEYPFALGSYPMSVAASNDYAVSVYLKSDRPGLRLRLAADFEDRQAPVAVRELEAGPTWERATLVLTNYPFDRVALSVTPLDSGALWVDAVQIERGRAVTAYGPCWYDAGFALPMFQAHVPPPASYPDKTHKVVCAVTNLAVLTPTLVSDYPTGSAFRLTCAVTNSERAAFEAVFTAALEVLDHETQFRTAAATLNPGERCELVFPGFAIPVDRHRCRVTVTATDRQGIQLRGERYFLDVPHPLRVYPEFSHYTTETVARVAAVFRGGSPDGATLELATVLALQRSTTMARKAFPVQPGAGRQLFTIPINTAGWTPLTPYTIQARLLDKGGKPLASSECELNTVPPPPADIRINRINRGLYVDGEPFIPYGAQFSGVLLDDDQLRFYKSCGFDYLSAVSHTFSAAKVREFLGRCAAQKLRVGLMHLSRKYTAAPGTVIEQLKDCPALVLFNPVDETGQVDVYAELARAQHRDPRLLCFVNENSAGYKNFSDQLRGFPGEVLSCDRYPLISQPPGWPQTATDVNGIYSCEERLEWMDRDGERDRKPLHFYLQAAEHTSREPVPAELDWLTYIGLVNRCLAFTYFAGLPASQSSLAAVMRLNREVQSLKPALFSLEEDPPVAAADEPTRSRVRFLAKRLGGELTVIAVNRGLAPVDAALDLSAAGVAAGSPVEVLFENRRLAIAPGGRLADRFEPLARHVYRVRAAQGAR